jgi:hypothetical protein
MTAADSGLVAECATASGDLTGVSQVVGLARTLVGTHTSTMAGAHSCIRE